MALAALMIGVASACGGGQSSGSSPTAITVASVSVARGPLIVTTRFDRFEISAAVRNRIAGAMPANARTALHFYLSRHRTLHTPRLSLVSAWSRGDVSRLLSAIHDGASRIALVNEVRAIQLRLPTIHQVWRNNCESAALSIMLDGRVSQVRLQQLLPKAQPYLPERDSAGAPVWGDPNVGFVGPATGGGYGVYHGPLLALARRYDPGATDLSGTSVARIVDALRHGRPVVAWIQLGASIPVTWDTPTGTVIHANWAEHAVTLTGWRPGALTYNNPWTGTTEQFTIPDFTHLWNTLGDQAIAGSSVGTTTA